MPYSDYVTRMTDAGTKTVPFGAGANVTISNTTANGTPTHICGIMCTGNAANGTGAANVVIYDGDTSSALNIRHTVIGNVSVGTYVPIKAPLVGGGNIVISAQGNSSTGWVSFFSGGTGGQPGSNT